MLVDLIRERRCGVFVHRLVVHSDPAGAHVYREMLTAVSEDAQEIHSNRKKQWLFFHMRSWIGKVDTKPTESTWYNMRVRYVRVVDDRNHGKWAAINVSKL